MTINTMLKAAGRARASSAVREIIIYPKGASASRNLGLDTSSFPEPVADVICDDKLINAVFKALPLTRSSHKPAWQNRGIGIFIFADSGGRYAFRHRGPYAADGFRGGQDFGGVGRHRVRGSSGLVISTPQWESIRNGALHSVDSINHYRKASDECDTPVFVQSMGDFKAMMLYHHSYEAAIQIKY